MISVQCSSCKRIQEVREASIGKSVQCNDCGTMFVARQPQPQSAQQEETLLAAGAPRQRDPAAVGGLARKADQRHDLPPTGQPAPNGLESGGPGPKRPFGLTWVVFYWILMGAISIIGGSSLTVMTGALAGAVRGNNNPFGEVRQAGQSAAALELLSFVGLVLFHYGLLTLVACYGLWTFRRWGFILARATAVAGVVLSLIAVVFNIVYLTGILAGVVGLIISVVILVYLFIGPGFSAQIRQHLRLDRLQEGVWQGYE